MIFLARKTYVCSTRSLENGLKDLLFIGCLIIICFATIYTGVAPVHKFGHDIFFLLENSWRLINGQCTQVDYSSAWGPVSFLIIALGLSLANFSVDGIGYANAIFGFFIGLWSFWLGRKSLPHPFRVLVSLFLVGLVIAPYALSYGVFNTTYAMVYNRYGYALVGLVILETMKHEQNKRTAKSDFVDGFSTGAAIAITFFLKVSYFFVSVFIVVGVSLILKRFSQKRTLGIIIGLVLVTVAFLIYLKFDFKSIYNELYMAAGARSESLNLLILAKKIFFNIILLPVLILFCVGDSLKAINNGFPWKEFRLVLISVIIFLADIALIFTNQQWYELPLVALLVLIAVSNTFVIDRMKCNKSFYIFKRTNATRLIIGAALFVPIFIFQYLALTHAVLEKKNPPAIASISKFLQPRLKGLLLYEGETPASNGSQYTAYVNEGVSLLLNFSSNNETVLTIDMFNPFPFALGRKPSTGGIAAAAFNYTISNKHKPSDERFFGNSDIVMVPKRPAGGDYFPGVLKIYEIGLKENYLLITQSDWWYLYKRKNDFSSTDKRIEF